MSTATEDFASALENFTVETEEASGDDNVIKGTVLKLTATHVVVDIGAKSEGMLPLSEVLDHEGKPMMNELDRLMLYWLVPIWQDPETKVLKNFVITHAGSDPFDAANEWRPAK